METYVAPESIEMLLEEWLAVPDYRKIISDGKRYLLQMNLLEGSFVKQPVNLPRGDHRKPDRVEHNIRTNVGYIFNGDKLVRTVKHCPINLAFELGERVTGIASFIGTANTY